MEVRVTSSTTPRPLLRSILSRYDWLEYWSLIQICARKILRLFGAKSVMVRLYFESHSLLGEMAVETSVQFVRLVYRCVLDYVAEKARSEACTWGDCGFGHFDCETHFLKTKIPDLLRRIQEEDKFHRNIWNHVHGALDFAQVDPQLITEAFSLAGNDLSKEAML